MDSLTSKTFLKTVPEFEVVAGLKLLKMTIGFKLSRKMLFVHVLLRIHLTRLTFYNAKMPPPVPSNSFQ